MDVDVNSQISDTYSETFSSSDTVDFKESNTFKQYEFFNTKLYGEETNSEIDNAVDSEAGLWIDAFPHLRIVGKNIFPRSNKPNSFGGEFVEEIIAEHHDTDPSTSDPFNEDNDFCDIEVKSGSIWGSETVILDGHPDDKSASDEFYDFDKDLDNLYSYSPEPPDISPKHQVRNNKYNNNNLTNTPTDLSKNFLAEKSNTFIKLNSTFNHNRVKSKQNDSNEREKTAVHQSKLLLPLEKKVNKFPYRRVPTRVISKFSIGDKSEKVPSSAGRLVQTVTSKTSFKPKLNSLIPLTRMYTGTSSLNHYNKIPPIPASKK